MRHWSSLAALAGTAVFAFGQSLGTKRDIATGTGSGSGPIVQPMDLVQMLVAVALVGALVKWVLPKAVAKLGRRISTPVGSTIELEESASFGGGQLQIVSVRGRTLLLCVASTGVTCLADLTEATAAAGSLEPAFFDVLDSSDPARAVVSADAPESDEEGMSMDEAVALISTARSRTFEQPASDPLDRLNRLTGT
jgi:flagellar biogenesis protein FliO